VFVDHIRTDRLFALYLLIATTGMRRGEATGLRRGASTWRRPYATAALKAGVHPKVISERLGHADVAFTLRTYSHVIPGMDAAAAELIAGRILGDPPPPAPAAETTPQNGPVHDSVHEKAGLSLNGGSETG